MTLYRVVFDRIGRDHSPEPLVVDVEPLSKTPVRGDADILADRVHGYARRRLSSREYSVIVDLDAMRGSIEAGRFGTFSVEVMSDD